MAPRCPNPLEIPEILRIISRFVAPRDAIACARVCRRWSNDFVATIWHTIDFALHTNLSSGTHLKAFLANGCHIRVARNVQVLDHIMLLIVCNAFHLNEMSLTMTPTQEFYTFCGNLLRKYKATIQHLRILQPIAASTVPHFPIDTLINAGTSSKLSHLEMEGLTMSRDGFSSFLQACPSLHSLGLRRMTLLSGPIYYPSGDNYYPKHHTLQTLSASIKQVFMPDVSNKSRIPPLLVHFPGLKSWRILNEGTTSSHEIPIIEIRDQVIEFCPSITSLELYIPPPVTVDILAHVIRKVAKVYVLNKHLSTEVVMAILHHQETLTNVGTFPSTADMYNSDSVPNVERNQLEGAGWIIQSIPRRCTSLTILCLPLFEMSMDDIEKAEWACQKLKILYFRVQGLNTKEKIDRAIQLWMEARIPRRKKRASKNRHKTIPNSDNSIEARVARHLLKFKKLREVWLGYKIRKVA